MPDDVIEAMTDYDQNSYVWQIENIRTIEPFDVVGRLGLYEVRMP